MQAIIKFIIKIFQTTKNISHQISSKKKNQASTQNLKDLDLDK